MTIQLSFGRDLVLSPRMWEMFRFAHEEARLKSITGEVHIAKDLTWDTQTYRLITEKRKCSKWKQ